MTVDPGVKLAVLQQRKYSSTKWFRVMIRAGEMGTGDLEIAAKTWALAAVNSGVRLEYWSSLVGDDWVVVDVVDVDDKMGKFRWIGDDDDDDDGLVKAT